jgi:hypothetical protein
MKTKLARIFDELLQEIDTNADLRARIERHISPTQDQAGLAGPKPKPKNKRGAPALDPYVEIKQGELLLRQKLTSLSIDQLKDIVSGYALDASRLALKWKDQGRLVEFIIMTVRSRMEKGDAFRTDSGQPM